MCIEKIKYKKAKLVIVAIDASENTKAKFGNICKDNNIPIVEFGNKVDLSRAIGKDNKTVLAVLDNNFVKSIMKMFEENKGAIC